LGGKRVWGGGAQYLKTTKHDEKRGANRKKKPRLNNDGTALKKPGVQLAKFQRGGGRGVSGAKLRSEKRELPATQKNFPNQTQKKQDEREQ